MVSGAWAVLWPELMATQQMVVIHSGDSGLLTLMQWYVNHVIWV